MAQRGDRRITWGDVRRDIAWSLFVVFFVATSMWFIVVAFYNYYYASNVTQYVANLVSRLVGQDLALNYTCSTSPCRIDLGPGNKVLNLTVENPTTSPLVILLRGEGGATATVAVYGSIRLTICFTSSLNAEFYPTNALTVVNPKSVGVSETTTAEVEVVPLLSVNTFFATISTVVGVLTSSLVYNHVAKKPLTKIYHRRPVIWGIVLALMPALFFASVYLIAYFNIWTHKATQISVITLLLAYVLFKLHYPLIFIYSKLLVLKGGLSLHEKAGVLHIIDTFWMLWIAHWAFDPLTALSLMYWDKIIQPATGFMLSLVIAMSLFALPLVIPLMLPLFRLRTLLFFIPFALNYELAARDEFCKRARSRLVAVALEAEGRVYRGVVTACDGDVVVIDGGEGEYVVPWSKVDHVLEAREVADLGRGEAKALLKSVGKGSVVVVHKGSGAPYLYIYAEGRDCEIAFEGRLPVAGGEAVGRGSAVVKCSGEEVRLDAAPGDAAEGTAHYKCPTRFKAAVVALGPTRVEPRGCQPAEVRPYTVENI